MMWYIPLVRALRAHIERKHLEQDGAMDELRFTEEIGKSKDAFTSISR